MSFRAAKISRGFGHQDLGLPYHINRLDTLQAAPCCEPPCSGLRMPEGEGERERGRRRQNSDRATEGDREGETEEERNKEKNQRGTERQRSIEHFITSALLLCSLPLSSLSLSPPISGSRHT